MRRLVGGVALVSLVTSVAGAHIATADQGDLDPSFGGGYGFVSTSIGTGNYVNALAIQSDGKIVAAGDAEPGRLVLLRYNGDGSPDTTFGGQGSEGHAVINGVYTSALDVAIDSSNRVVVLALLESSTFLQRYTSTGDIDTGFAGGAPPLVVAVAESHSNHRVQVALTPDGKIVVGGSDGNGDFFVRRFTSAGTADTSFGGGDGIVTTSVPGWAFNGAVGIRLDGKIVVAGSVSTSDPIDGIFSGDCEVTALRYLADGSPDTTFGGDGQVSTVTEGCLKLTDLALAPDGQVVTSALRNDKQLLFRFLPSGNGSGHAELTTERTSTGGYLNALAVQTDGKVVIGGRKHEAGEFRMRLVRLTENMTLDTSFGGGDGEVVQDLGTDFAEISSLAIAPDNGIVAGGQFRPSGYDHFTVARFSAISEAATLRDLSLSTGSLTETFDSGTTSYSASVPNSVKSITITPTATDRNAVITVDNATTTSGSASAPISLKHGANYVNLRVTAQDGLTEKIYTITVTRLNANLKVKKTMTAKSALASVDKPLPSGAKVSITVAKASKKVCSVSAGKIRGLKKGTCRVTVAVTPPRTALVKKPKTTRTAVTITVN